MGRGAAGFHSDVEMLVDVGALLGAERLVCSLSALGQAGIPAGWAGVTITLQSNPSTEIPAWFGGPWGV